MSNQNDIADIQPFFHPAGIALIGATDDPTKLGFILATNLIRSGYHGAIHLVNPRGGSMFGMPVYEDIQRVPDPVTLAVLLIPAQAMPAALAACGERGIRAAIVAAGGFRETGEAGAQLEEECLAVARRYGLRFLGPNCIGILDTHLPLDTTFLPPPGPTPGGIAFISHSGAICAAVIDWARGQGFGLSRLVSLGNQADVCETDVLEPVADDEQTRVVTLYLEGVRDGRRFVEIAGRVSRRKPLIALKVGRYESGRQAVASHTGALAGQESAFDAAFRRAGVLRANTSEQLFDWARALAWCPLPAGPRVAVLTNAGGPGVTAADTLEARGLQLAPLEAGTTAGLRALLPPAASLRNPVDMLASATPEQYAGCLRLLLADRTVDSVLIIVPPPLIHAAGGVAKAIIPIIHTAEKPVVLALMGERLIAEAVEHLRAARVPEYRFPERAADALATLVARARYLAEPAQKPAPLSDVRTDEARRWLAEADLPPGAQLPDGLLQRLLACYNIPTPPSCVADTVEAAVEAAEQLGMPVVLKVVAAGVTHKSDVGGVLLNLGSREAVAAGYEALRERLRAAAPEARFEGVQMQPMAPPGQEVIVGAVHDAQFGALLMFGSGGVDVEGLRDVAFALAPATQIEAERLLADTWAGRKLRGYRSLPPADREAALEVIVRLGQLAADLPELAEIEINPLRVLEAGQGVLALDVRASLR